MPKNFRPIHGLRHADTSMLASSGQVDIYTLQKLMTHYAREAILEHIEDLEDAYVALDRLKKPAKRMSMKEVEQKLGLES